MHIDFSKQAVAAILHQMQRAQPGGVWEEYFIACKGRKLMAYEQNYHSSKGKLLALYYGVQKFSHFLMQAPFRVVTDSKTVTHWETMRDPGGTVRRWLAAGAYCENNHTRFSIQPMLLSEKPRNTYPGESKQKSEKHRPEGSRALPAVQVCVQACRMQREKPLMELGRGSCHLLEEATIGWAQESCYRTCYGSCYRRS